MEAEIGLQLTELLVVALGALTSLIMGGLKMGLTGLDKLPKPAKAMVVAALAVPIALLGGWIGVDLPGDVTTWDGNVINVILTWLTAMGVRAGTKAIVKQE